MVERLNGTASAMDHVKQELLFIARDDIPKMFRELPQGVNAASQRVQKRLSIVDGLIRNQQRQSAESVLPMMPAIQPQQPNSDMNVPPANGSQPAGAPANGAPSATENSGNHGQPSPSNAAANASSANAPNAPASGAPAKAPQ